MTFSKLLRDPFANNTPLRNINILIPEPAKTDILTVPEKGAALSGDRFKEDLLSQERKALFLEKAEREVCGIE